MFVAVLAYFISTEANLPNDRVVDNFFAALLHDLPETLTRDIISPVKNAAPEIADIIADIERERFVEEIIGCVPESWRQHLCFLTGQLYEHQDGKWRIPFDDPNNQFALLVFNRIS